MDAANKPLRGAEVVLISNTRRNNLNFYYRRTSDDSGKFTLTGVAPGEYKLFAWPGSLRGAYYNPEFLAQYEDRGKPMSIASGARITTNVSAAPSENR